MPDTYINFFTDFGFKKLFGTEANKDLLIDFLNVLLKGYEKPIRDLAYRRDEQLGNSEPDRKAIFDLYCESESGDRFIVELQKAEQKYFKDRSVFYSTFPIQEAARRGEWDFRLPNVYTIGILDFVFDEDADDPDKYIYHVKPSDIETNHVFYEKLTFVYIEMPKFRKTEEELKTHFDKWLYALRNLSRLERIPGILRERIFETFFERARVARLEPNERNAYENSLKYYRDMQNVIATAEERALDKGEQTGMEKGRAEGVATAVKSLHAGGMSTKDIARNLNLPMDSVRRILEPGGK